MTQPTRKDVISVLDAYVYALERETADLQARLDRVLGDLRTKQDRVTALVEENRALMEAAEERISALAQENRRLKNGALRTPATEKRDFTELYSGRPGLSPAAEDALLGARPSEK